MKTATGVRQSLKLMKDGDDLYDESKGLAEYADRYKIVRLNYSYSNSNYQTKDKTSSSEEVLIINY